MLKEFNLSYWLDKFQNKRNRTKNVLFGAFSLVGSQGAGSVIGMLITAVIVRSFSAEEFGLWSLLMSLTGIFAGIDLGFGNALRNKLAQLSASNETNREDGRNYFFAIFYVFLPVALILSIVMIIFRQFVPWGALFHTSNLNIIQEGSWLFVIGGVLSLINVVFMFNNAGFFAYQETHITALYGFVSRFCILLMVVFFVYWRLSFFTITSMFFVIVLLFSIISFLVFLKRRGWNVVRLKYKIIIKKVKELWGVSAQFTMLQVLSIIYVSIDLFLISKLLGLSSVGDYALVKKIYMLIGCFHFAFLMPIWSAYTEAVVSDDFVWVKNALRKSAFFTVFVFVVAGIFLSILGNNFIYIWTGKRIVNMLLYILLGFHALINGWGNCFSVFLNSVGILKGQIVLSFLGVLIVIPASFYLSKIFGLLGICCALIIAVIPTAIYNPIRSYIYIKNRE
jgi:O-antigen/teichoic acid export membrane protein